MAYFRLTGTTTSGPAVHASGISDLAVVAGADGARVVSVTGIQGGLMARTAGAAMTVAETAAWGAGPLRTGLPQIETVTLGGRAALVTLDPDGGATGHWLGGGTARVLDEGFALLGGSARWGSLVTVALSGGRDAIFATGPDATGVSAWVRSASGAVSAAPALDVGLKMQGQETIAIEAVSQGGQEWLLASSSREGSLSLFRLDANGRASLADTLTAPDGFAVNTPTRIETAQVDGRTYALVGSAGTSSITVVEMGSGQLSIVDQVNDTLSTRFQGVSVLETIEMNGRTFVVAGGGDDGLSLMTLLPGGRLLHLETIADSLTSTLNNPEALALAVEGGRIAVYVAGQGEAGLSRFEIDPGPLARPIVAQARDTTMQGSSSSDLLIGGAGSDLIEAGAGRDILIDGAGSDSLRGGEGADIFVLVPDGAHDRILDFEVGVDSLDLSAFGRVYSASSLSARQVWNGIEYSWGDEVVQITSSTRTPIAPGTLADTDLFNLWHVGPVPFVPSGIESEGGTLADTLIGTVGHDSFCGDLGADRLVGMGGNDRLYGEMLDPDYDPVAAQVYRLYVSTLGRAPDMAGHTGWTNHLLSGTPLDTVVSGFIGSREFALRFDADTTTEFVTLLYANVLGRAPDAAGLAGWVRAVDVNGMSRATLVTHFSDSAENLLKTEAAALAYGRIGHQADWGDEVFRLYSATLGRAPDAAGFWGWSNRLAQGYSIESVADGFVGSREFSMRYDADATRDFVTLLYTNVLGRTPDAGGLENWVRAIDLGGMSRASAALGFSESRENVARSQPAFEAFMEQAGEGDRIEGGAGTNILWGGLGADTFVFDAADRGTHHVSDLEAWDNLEFSGFGYADAAQARAHMIQSGADVVFRDAGTTIVFEDTRLSEIDPDQFIL